MTLRCHLAPGVSYHLWTHHHGRNVHFWQVYQCWLDFSTLEAETLSSKSALEQRHCISSSAYGMKWYRLTVNKVGMRSSTAYLLDIFIMVRETGPQGLMPGSPYSFSVRKQTEFSLRKSVLTKNIMWKLNYKDPMWSQYSIIATTHTTAVHNLLQVLFTQQKYFATGRKNIKIKVKIAHNLDNVQCVLQ